MPCRRSRFRPVWKRLFHRGIGERHDLSSPRQGHAVRNERTGRPGQRRQAARLRGGHRRHRAGRAGGERALHRRGDRPAERGGRPQPEPLEGWHGDGKRGLQGSLPAVRPGRLAGRAASGRIRRPGFAQADRHGLHRNAERGQPVVRAVPAADRRRHRGAADGRQRGAEAALCAEADLGRVDRHDEPDRAAGRLRPRPGAHACRAGGRRHLQGLRHEDLHHLGRARHGREHRPPGAGAHAGRAGGREGHFAVRGAQVPGQCGWLAGRA